MSNYRTPGVYIKELNLLPPSVAEVSTAIPAFIGYTEKAKKAVVDDLRMKPTRITSLLEYETYFGTSKNETITVTMSSDENGRTIITPAIAAPSPYLMHYSIQMFFNNGGGPCYVVSVGSHTDAISQGDTNSAETPFGLLDGLTALKKEDEPTLLIFPDALALVGPQHGSLMNSALNQCFDLKDRFVIMDVKGTPKEFRDSVTGGATPESLTYGATYYPNLITTLPYAYSDADVTVTDNRTETPASVLLSTIKTTDAEAYNLVKNRLSSFTIELPPSGALAGIYASVDNARGVWKAPANVGLIGIIAPVVKISDEDQKMLNMDSTSGKSINAIRSFPGKGTLVWGARTLAGNDNQWRYINVRRLFIMIEESIQKATRFAIFEPNTASTWLKVKAMIESYLYGLWQQGALAGSKPEHAYFVRVGLNVTMTQSDISEGIMRVSVGIAAVRPAEFVEISFSHKLQES